MSYEIEIKITEKESYRVYDALAQAKRAMAVTGDELDADFDGETLKASTKAAMLIGNGLKREADKRSRQDKAACTRAYNKVKAARREALGW